MRIDSHVHVWTMGEPPFTHNDQMVDKQARVSGSCRGSHQVYGPERH